MAAAAAAILRNHGSGVLHPYATDYFTNEVHTTLRYDLVHFPDVNTTVASGSLSYTIGDLGQVYHITSSESLPPKRFYNAVLTCFFIDTATNIFDYITAIQNMLAPRTGIWINVGPLHWHRNAILQISADELKAILQSMDFEILHWSVDVTPMEYRSSSDRQNPTIRSARSTHYDAYCPLRFVVRNID